MGALPSQPGTQMQTGKYRGHAADLKSAYVEQVGVYELALIHRNVDGDQGLTLHVFGPVDGKQEEILRFDCFETTPHYHLGWSYQDLPFIKIDDPNPLAWVIDSLDHTFEDFIRRANAELDMTGTSRAELSDALRRIREQSLALEG